MTPAAVGPLGFVVSYGYDAGLPVTQYANGIPMVTAVRYQPSGSVSSYTTGVVGEALEALPAGEGEILVLLSLQ